MFNAKAWLLLHSASYDGMLFIWGKTHSYVKRNMMFGTAGPLVLVRLKLFTKAAMKLLK